MTSGLPDPSFWASKRVFLTGHTGFKGAWLAIWLRRLGAEVTGFALAPEGRTIFEAARLDRGMVSICGDIRDQAALSAAMRQADPEIVLHLAAQALVRRSYDQPVETFATNVMGTAHVLEAARHAPSVRAVVVVTTDKVYENREWVWPYRETDTLGGHDPYSASKAGAELVTAAWRRSFFSKTQGSKSIAVASARAGNVIGGGDWSLDRLVPDCIQAFVAGRTVMIRNPNSTRPWQHVLEPLNGYLLLAERLCTDGHACAQAWNFGPVMDDVQPVTAVVRGLAACWGENARWEVADGPHPHEAGLLAVDPARARALLGWRPRLRLEPALDWTGRWYHDHEAGADAAVLVANDIERYEAIGTTP